MGAIERLVILALVVYGVWQVGRRVMNGGADPQPQPSRGGRARGAADRATIEDLSECRACGSYVAAASGACARPDCPRRG